MSGAKQENEKGNVFLKLIDAINECDLCDRMCSREKILSNYNGSVYSKIIFVAEAPGRLGADRTTIPLYGDRTGDQFEIFINNIGWSRDDFFITNAVLCNPRKTDGTNDRPNSLEITNCSIYLEMLINLIRPLLIVTLGVTALRAIDKIERHRILLKNDVGKLIPWNGIKVMPLYHPGPRALIHRNVTKQRSDYINLANIFDPLVGFKQKAKKETTSKVENEEDSLSSLIIAILQIHKELSYFKLTKLLYLIDLNFIISNKRSYTGEIYLRQKDGPWPPALSNKVKSLINKGVIRKFYKKRELILAYNEESEAPVSIVDYHKIREIVTKYITYDNYQIKYTAYRSMPMRFILKQEKMGLTFLNRPVIYKNRTIVDEYIDEGSDIHRKGVSGNYKSDQL